DRAQPGGGLREGHRAGGRGLQEREGHHRDHPREEDPQRATDRRPPRSGQAVEPSPEQIREEVTATNQGALYEDVIEGVPDPGGGPAGWGRRGREGPGRKGGPGG